MIDFRAIIKEQREELEEIDKRGIIVREGLNTAKRFIKYPNVVVVLGIRRCGKSIFSYLLVRDSLFGYINFDDERLAGIKTKDLNEILQAFYELYGEGLDIVVLDEIQNIEGWELFVNRLRRTKKVIITGSNSKLLSGELATHLTGRHIDINLFPFSFNEFLILNGFKKQEAYTTKEKAELIKLFNEYFDIGGFPEVYIFGKLILSKVYEDIIIKDIVLRHRIKNVNGLKNLAKYLVSHSADEISYSRLIQFVEVKHVATISKWVSYLEDSFLIIKVERFSFKLKEQFIAPKKIYCIDNGLVKSIGFMFSDNTGNRMENLVAVDLKRRVFRGLFSEFYYWKDHFNNEVDFVLKKATKVSELIQVTYVNDYSEIKERELRSLLKASKELKCNKLVVITWNFEDEMNIKNKKINFIPLWKWLLNY